MKLSSHWATSLLMIALILAGRFCAWPDTQFVPVAAPAVTQIARMNAQFANAFRAATVAKEGSARQAQLKRMEEALDKGAKRVNIESFYVDSFRSDDISSSLTKYSWTPLHLAAREDALTLADKLINRGAALEARPLNYQSSSGTETVVNDTNDIVTQGVTTENTSFEDAPLFWAIRFNSVRVARRLIEAGARLQPVPKGADDTQIRPTYFEMALRQTEPQMAILLINVPRNTALNRFDWLVKAHEAKRNKVVEFLVEKIDFAVPLDAKSGWSALHRLAAYNSSDLLQLAHERGAKLPMELATADGKTPLWLAVENGATATAAQLRGWGAEADIVVGGQSLWVQACETAPALAAAWVSAQPRVVVPNDWKGVAFATLHEGRKWPSLTYLLAKLQLKYGATAWPAYGKIPINYRTMKPEWYRIAVQLGGDINRPDVYGLTALQQAVGSDNLVCAQIALDSGARADVSLMQSVRSAPVARLLVANGADPSARFDNGLTPLLQAARTAPRETVSAILEVTPDPFVADNAGNNALHRAAIYNRPDLVPLLLAQKFDPKTKNRDGRTALDLARHHNKPDVVRALEN